MINDAGCMREIGITTTIDTDGKKHNTGIYGMEAVLDCHHCNTKLFTRKHLRRYFKGLVEILEMQAADLHFYNEPGGLGAVQFILTSNITVHCVNKLERVYINIFSCKEFDAYKAKDYTQNFFEVNQISAQTVLRW